MCVAQKSPIERIHHQLNHKSISAIHFCSAFFSCLVWTTSTLAGIRLVGCVEKCVISIRLGVGANTQCTSCESERAYFGITQWSDTFRTCTSPRTSNTRKDETRLEAPPHVTHEIGAAHSTYYTIYTSAQSDRQCFRDGEKENAIISHRTSKHTLFSRSDARGDDDASQSFPHPALAVTT